MGRKKLLVGLAVLVVSLPVSAGAGAGDLDKRFGRRGVASADVNKSLDYTTDVALQPDGRVLVTGITRPLSPGGSLDVGVARFTKNGARDRSFAGDGAMSFSFGAEDIPTAIAAAPGGKVVVAGSRLKFMSNYRYTSDFAVARLTKSGALDKSFSNDGRQTTDILGENAQGDFASAVAVQPDGKIIVAGGTFATVTMDEPVNYGEASGLAMLVRYNTDGSLDPTFGSGGRVVLNIGGGIQAIEALLIQPDGFIVAVGGASTTVNMDETGYDFMTLRLTPVGTLDPTFGTGGRVLTDFNKGLDWANSVVRTRSGDLIVAGSSTSSGRERAAVVRYNPDGSLDTGFSRDGKTTLMRTKRGQAALSAALQRDGKLLVGGYEYRCTTQSGNGWTAEFCTTIPSLVRLRSDGSVDASYGTRGWKVGGTGLSGAGGMAIQGSKAVIGGTVFNRGARYTDLAVARLKG